MLGLTLQSSFHIGRDTFAASKVANATEARAHLTVSLAQAESATESTVNPRGTGDYRYVRLPWLKMCLREWGRLDMVMLKHTRNVVSTWRTSF